MKKIFTATHFATLSILIIIFSGNELYAQNLLNRPESVVFDSVYNRYLVSNWANGRIIQIDSNGVQEPFISGHGSINGVAIADGIVFACCSTKVKGFELSSKDTVMDLAIPGALNINDVTSDNAGNIYLTDFDAKKIYKVNILSHAYSTFVSGLVRSPNGIIYEEMNNRLLVCSFGYNIPILAIDLADSTVSVVANTNLANCDGFAKDDFGRYYITSWYTLSIYRFDSVFSNPPEVFYTNSGAPVDISYNSRDDILAVPLMNANSVVFIPITPVSVKDEDSEQPQKFLLNQNYPNPFNPTTKITFQIPETGLVILKIYDLQGNEITTLVNEEKPTGEYEVEFNGKELTSGIYFYQIQTSSYTNTKKMIYLK